MNNAAVVKDLIKTYGLNHSETLVQSKEINENNDFLLEVMGWFLVDAIWEAA